MPLNKSYKEGSLHGKVTLWSTVSFWCPRCSVVQNNRYLEFVVGTGTHNFPRPLWVGHISLAQIRKSHQAWRILMILRELVGGFDVFSETCFGLAGIWIVQLHPFRFFLWKKCQFLWRVKKKNVDEVHDHMSRTLSSKTLQLKSFKYFSCGTDLRPVQSLSKQLSNIIQKAKSD